MASLHKYLTEASLSQTCVGYLETSAGRSLKKPEKWTKARAEPNSCSAKLHQYRSIWHAVFNKVLASTLSFMPSAFPASLPIPCFSSGAIKAEQR